MSTKDWIRFRTRLFEKMEVRRAKAANFLFEQVYLFISRCRQLFISPGTKEAQDALEAIQDEGTFLLVADSLGAFIKMFSAVEDQEDADKEPVAQPDERSANPGPDLRPQPNAPAARDGTMPEPAVPRRTDYRAYQQPLERSQPQFSARRSSGNPFRR